MNESLFAPPFRKCAHVLYHELLGRDRDTDGDAAAVILVEQGVCHRGTNCRLGWRALRKRLGLEMDGKYLSMIFRTVPSICWERGPIISSSRPVDEPSSSKDAICTVAPGTKRAGLVHSSNAPALLSFDVRGCVSPKWSWRLLTVSVRFPLALSMFDNGMPAMATSSSPDKSS